MRVSAETKLKTRRRILESAQNLFADKGFEEVTTRDLARAAGIASGTLFNYFATKDSLGLAIVALHLDDAREEFLRTRRADESLEESLFAHIAGALRHLAPCRGYILTILETVLTPYRIAHQCESAERIRADHMETVHDLIAGAPDAPGLEPSSVAMHLYWTLFIGVLSFWSHDDSPGGEATLAYLDQSTRLFVAALRDPAPLHAPTITPATLPVAMDGTSSESEAES